MDKTSRIMVLGAQGMVGSALVRVLRNNGYVNVCGISRSDGIDVSRPGDLRSVLAFANPEYVFLAAATVGGIWANSHWPADFIEKNLSIVTNVVRECHLRGVKRLLTLGSSCIYPRKCPQPIKEACLLTGPLEPTNEPYAIAKIAGVSLCESYNRQCGTDYICAMPCNLYGPGDNFDTSTGHFIPALMSKMHLAKMRGDDEVELWGDGYPRREAMYVEDCAGVLIELMKNVHAWSLPERRPIVNVGNGRDLSIRDIAAVIADVVGFDGEFLWDYSKPTGTPKKVLDLTLLRSLGIELPNTSLSEGLELTYQWYLDNMPARRSDARQTLPPDGNE